MLLPVRDQSAEQREARWREATRSFAQRPGVLLDLGGGSPFQGYVTAQALGSCTTYLCLDIKFEAHPHVVGDALDLPLAAESVDLIYCNAVLEHLPEPQRAVEEMYRVLAKQGAVMVAVPFVYPYHDQVDYYRFTDTALRYLFRQFAYAEIVPVGDYLFATWMFLCGFNYAWAYRIDRYLGFTRAVLHWALAGYDRTTTGRPSRNYLRALTQSPVGWHIYAKKANT